MEHSTVGQPSASDPRRTDSTPDTLHIGHTKLPSLGGTGPILPEWLRKLFRRKDTHAAN
jgi:hypothetical protein